MSWPDLYARHHAEIEADPDDLLRPAVDNPELDQEGEEEEEEQSENEEIRPDWMLLAEMGRNAVIDYWSDLGSRDMDRKHDWINDARQHYSDLDLAEAGTFVPQAGNIQAEAENLTIDPQTLNERQSIIFERIKAHYQDILTGHPAEALRIIVLGTAGTGKSYLIKATRSQLQDSWDGV